MTDPLEQAGLMPLLFWRSMIPLADNRPTPNPPLLTWALIAACIAAFLWQISALLPFDQAVGEYGFIPARIFGGIDEDDDILIFPTSPWVTLFSSMFLHGDVTHLAGNMLYLWVFGDTIENALGKLKYLAFYLLCGLAAALTQGLADPLSTTPMIGASGAISGILGAYLVLYPRQRITVAMPYVGITRLPALIVLGLWFIYQLLYSLAPLPEGSGGIAFGAHIGGFIAGAVLAFAFHQPRKRPVLWQA